MDNNQESGLRYIKDLEGNSIRPYTTGATEHEDPIATIILYHNNKGTDFSTADPNIVDYTTSFSKNVKTLISGSINSSSVGAPEIPNGDIPMLTMNTTDDYYGVFNNFSVTGLTESSDQISKVHMNFSARWNVFFFGNSPKMINLRGVFIDTQEYPYYQEFMVAYEKYLCGRKCIENMMQTKLMISGQIIDGYLLSVNVSHNSSTPTLKEFSINMLVKGSSWIRFNYTHPGGTLMQINGKNAMVFNGLSNLNRLGGSTDQLKKLTIY